jgi:FG-GAP repeat
LKLRILTVVREDSDRRGHLSKRKTRPYRGPLGLEHSLGAADQYHGFWEYRTELRPHQNFAAENGPVSVTSADLNGDGKADLAVANQSANIVSVLLNHLDKAVISGSPANRNNSLPELTSGPRAVSCSSYVLSDDGSTGGLNDE